MSKDNLDYLDVVYSEKVKPKTSYPHLLAAQLMERFSIAPGMDLLDVGCGRGDMLEAFSAAGLKAKGLDRAESAFDREDDIEIINCNLNSEVFPFEEDSFDVVFAKSVIEHFLDPTYMLREMYRVLKPGGILVVLTPNWTSQHTNFFEDPTHVHPYMPKSMHTLLLLNSFTTPSVQVFCHHDLVWKGGKYVALAYILQFFLSVKSARWLTEKTGIKFFRWAVERQILAMAKK